MLKVLYIFFNTVMISTWVQVLLKYKIIMMFLMIIYIIFKIIYMHYNYILHNYREANKIMLSIIIQLNLV